MTDPYDVSQIISQTPLNSQDMISRGAPILADPVSSPSFFSSIMTWFYSNLWAHVFLLAFAVILIWQLYNNQKNKVSRINTVTGLFMLGGSLVLWLNTHWVMGALYFLISVWFIVQASKFKDEPVEFEEEQPEPIKQPQVQPKIPMRQPVRQIPQADINMFDNWQPPQIKIGSGGLGLNLF